MVSETYIDTSHERASSAMLGEITDRYLEGKLKEGSEGVEKYAQDTVVYHKHLVPRIPPLVESQSIGLIEVPSVICVWLSTPGWARGRDETERRPAHKYVALMGN